MLKRFIIILFIIFTQFYNLYSSTQKKEFDSAGRLIQINHYVENMLTEIEEYVYSSSNINPDKIIYKEKRGNLFIPFKELEYTYASGTISSIEFIRLTNGSRTEEGKITFTYDSEGRLSLTKYFIRLKPSGKLFMFALQQQLYSENELTTRRFVQYEINPETLKPMQSSQHVFLYRDNIPESMRSWILEETSQKIIENNEKDVKIIEKIIEDIEKKCIHRSSGSIFNRI